jgi:hypothetical protein
MNIIPKPPTDNLYKFIAITGVWFVFFVVASMMYISYLSFQIEREGLDFSTYSDSKYLIFKIDKRLTSISKKEFDKNVLDTIPTIDGGKREVQFLTNLKEIHSKVVGKYEIRKNESKYSDQIELINTTGLLWVVFMLVFSAVICFFYGFKAWFTQVQKPADNALKLDLELKQLSIDKLKLEIDIARKSTRTHFVRR